MFDAEKIDEAKFVTAEEQLEFARSIGLDLNKFKENPNGLAELRKTCLNIMLGNGADTSSPEAWYQQRRVAGAMLHVMNGNSKRVSISE